MNNYIKLMFCTGPGDCITDYKNWKSSKRTEDETSLTLTSHIFNFVSKNKINSWVISYNDKKQIINDNLLIIENRPKTKHFINHGIGYYLNNLFYTLNLFYSIFKFKPTHLIIDSGTTNWFTLMPLRIFNIEVIPNFHNTYYPITKPKMTLSKKIVSALDKKYFKSCTKLALGVSPETRRQYLEMSGNNNDSNFEMYFYQFDAQEFRKITKPIWPSEVFNILYCGRVTKEKGIFDLVKIAEIVNKKTNSKFHLDICGDGPDLQELTKISTHLSKENLITFHRHLKREDLLKIYSKIHLVVVPTTSSFCEGLPRVIIESILSFRPILTSKLSNCCDVLSEAIEESKPEDIECYANKIVNLMQDHDRYNQLSKACSKYEHYFTNSEFSLEKSLEKRLLQNHKNFQ